jgi:UDP-N-acetylmuramoylalanine--D-glutamate ligase
MQKIDTIIVGLGETGVSVARFLTRQNIEFSVCDTREKPSNLDKFQHEFRDVPVHLGKLDAELLKSAKQLIVSPGVAISSPAIVSAQQAGVEIIGDIELFIRHCDKPIIAITGSNGKTTTTTLVGEMAKASGFKVGVGGNIEIGGISQPALDLLTHDYNFYVLELSSFQLEMTTSLKAVAAVCVNVSDNHMDRYNSFQDYVNAKNRIYKNSMVSVINFDNPQSWETADLSKNKIGFTVEDANSPEGVEHCFNLKAGQLYFDHQVWLAVDALKIKTKHFCANLLAAFALGYSAGFKKEAMLQVAKSFSGVDHRCQTVAQKNGVMWINDSKGTTVAATTAAIESFGDTISGKIVLIAGGDGKGANFSGLTQPLEKYCRGVILLGRDAQKIADILPKSIEPVFVKSMADAVERAVGLARSGDAVLLSTACASTDMFKNYIDRGNQFIKYVNEV